MDAQKKTFKLLCILTDQEEVLLNILRYIMELTGFLGYLGIPYNFDWWVCGGPTNYIVTTNYIC